MSQALRGMLLSLREMLVSGGPIALLGLALLVLAYLWLDPNPPKTVTLATGPAQSAYDEFGKRYARALAVEGIQVVLVPSEGSSDNLRLLREGKVDLGFVQGGSAASGAEADETLLSLGSLFVEPVWLFYRAAAAKRVQPSGELTQLAQLKGLRISVGTPGSGVRKLVETLFEANRIDPAGLALRELDPTSAVVGFLGGEQDALVFASAPESLMVQMLLQTPDVRLMNFPQSEAYARRFAFLKPVLLPRGVVDLAADLPPQDVRLVASTTALISRESTHPALRTLFSQAAARQHSGAGWFNQQGDYPRASQQTIAMAPEAERTIAQGVPLLQRYLPFGLANLIERMWLVLGIILAMLLPLSRIVPPLYQFRIRSRVFRWYGQLRDIEERAKAGQDGAGLADELDTLAERVRHITVPLSYADELYALRSHIEAARQRLRAG